MENSTLSKHKREHEDLMETLSEFDTSDSHDNSIQERHHRTRRSRGSRSRSKYRHSHSMSDVTVSPRLKSLMDHDPVPLEQPWTFWYDPPLKAGATSSDYVANLKRICTVQTIQDFWGVWNNIPHISSLQLKSNLHIMVDKIQPLWEDGAHSQGGMWIFRLAKQYSGQVWQDLVVRALGEQFDGLVGSFAVTGVSISIRHQEDMLQVWTTCPPEMTHTAILQTIVRTWFPPNSIRSSYYKPHTLRKSDAQE